MLSETNHWAAQAVHDGLWLERWHDSHDFGLLKFDQINYHVNLEQLLQAISRASRLKLNDLENRKLFYIYVQLGLEQLVLRPRRNGYIWPGSYGFPSRRNRPLHPVCPCSYQSISQMQSYIQPERSESGEVSSSGRVVSVLLITMSHRYAINLARAFVWHYAHTDGRNPELRRPSGSRPHSAAVVLKYRSRSAPNSLIWEHQSSFRFFQYIMILQ